MRTQLICLVALLGVTTLVYAQGPGPSYNGLSGKNAFGSGINPSYQAGYGPVVPNYPAALNGAIPRAFGYSLTQPPPTQGGNVGGAGLIQAKSDAAQPQSISEHDTPSTTGATTNAQPVEQGPPVSELVVPSYPAIPSAGPSYLDPTGDNHAADADRDRLHRPTREKFWANFDYQLGWMRQERLSTPLVTTGSASDASPGALGQSGTAVLFGNHAVDFGVYSGIHADAGLFLDDKDHFSLELGGIYFIQNIVNYGAASDAAGNPVLARPVTDSVSGIPISYVNSLAGIDAGSVSVQLKSELIGGEFNGGYHIYPSERVHLEGLFGFRFLRLAEGLSIQDQYQPLNANILTFQGAVVNPPNSLADMDRFTTANNFYGFQFGGRATYEGQWFNLSAYGKIAFGGTEQSVNINGSTTLITPLGNTTTAGGILALPSNIGNYSRTAIGFVPEGGLNIGINICPHVQLMAGYSFLFWNQVLRPGQQIDPTVNHGQVPSDQAFGQTASAPAKPTFSFIGESFWVQSLNVGLGIHY